MAATTTLPDPTTEAIKLGRHPRRYYAWSCGWMFWPRNQKPDRYTGTPATNRDIRITASLCRVLFMTRGEILRMVDRHVRELERCAKKKRVEGKTDAYISEWWEGAVASADIRVPAWLARELDRVHGGEFVREHAAAAGLYFFVGVGDDEVTRWCEFATERDAEHRAIDTEAHAALVSIVSGEAVPR